MTPRDAQAYAIAIDLFGQRGKYTTSEIAEMVQKSRATVKRWRRQWREGGAGDSRAPERAPEPKPEPKPAKIDAPDWIEDPEEWWKVATLIAEATQAEAGPGSAGASWARQVTARREGYDRHRSERLRSQGTPEDEMSAAELVSALVHEIERMAAEDLEPIADAVARRFGKPLLHLVE